MKAKKKTEEETTLALRITLVEPPRDVAFCLQSGKSDHVQVSRAKGETLSFDLSVRVREAPDGSPRFLGPFTQGPASARFVYVNSGTSAGDARSPWTRRAKIALGGLTWPLIKKVAGKSGAFLEGRIRGRSKDGGPICASTPLLDGWSPGAP